MRRGLMVVGIGLLSAAAIGVVAAARSDHPGARRARPAASTSASTAPQGTDSRRPGAATSTSGVATTTTRLPAPTTAARPTTTSPTPAGRATLAGVVVTINPGHDGGNATHSTQINRQVWIGTNWKACDTVGTETNDGFPEHVFTWDTSMLVKAKLEAFGATVVLTRSNDSGWGPCIDQRAAIGNEARSAAVVSIHADGGPSSGRGFFVIAPEHTPGITSTIYDASTALATSIRDAVRAGTPMPTSDYAAADGFMRSGIYGGLNLTTVPAMFIECGNMRNATDAALLESPSYRDRLASAIVAGIVRFVR